MPSMSRDEILLKLTPIFRDVFDDDDIVPVLNMVAADVDEWDSLSHIRLIVSIEKEFQVHFSAAEIGGLKNVGGMVDLIEAKQ
jgi:acyl carrier protein